jgi:hypothetical protein
MPYTPEEIRQFEAKDKRINKVAVIKSMLEGLGASGNAYRTYVSDLTDPEWRAKLMEAADDFVGYIYRDTVATTNNDNAETSATDGLPVPTPEQIEVLENIIERYLSDYLDVEVNEYKLKEAIITEFGKYPTNPASVDVVVDRIPIATITN